MKSAIRRTRCFSVLASTSLGFLTLLMDMFVEQSFETTRGRRSYLSEEV